MSRLVWGCLWRGGLLGVGMGLGSGAIVGGITGAVVAPFVFFWSVPIGALAGGIYFGAPLGTVVGVADGLLVALLTHRWYNPPFEVHRYRHAAGALCAVASPALVLGVSGTLGLLDLSTEETYTYWRGPVNQVVLLGVLPAILAATLGWWCGRRLASWWAHQVEVDGNTARLG